MGPAGSFLLLNYNPITVVTKFGSNWMSEFPIGSYVNLYPTVAAIVDGEQTNEIQFLKRTTSGHFFFFTKFGSNWLSSFGGEDI